MNRSPGASAVYFTAFGQVLAYAIVMNFGPPFTSKDIIYLEFFVQNGLRVCFALFEWPTYVCAIRKVLLMMKSVQIYAISRVRVTGVFSVSMLRKLIEAIQKIC